MTMRDNSAVSKCTVLTEVDLSRNPVAKGEVLETLLGGEHDAGLQALRDALEGRGQDFRFIFSQRALAVQDLGAETATVDLVYGHADFADLKIVLMTTKQKRKTVHPQWKITATFIGPGCEHYEKSRTKCDLEPQARPKRLRFMLRIRISAFIIAGLPYISSEFPFMS
jgi:hypothetical protein